MIELLKFHKELIATMVLLFGMVCLSFCFVYAIDKYLKSKRQHFFDDAIEKEKKIKS